MSLRPRRRATVAVAVLIAMVTALVLASPASAHVEVSADNPQAGARNVTVTFTGEAESTTGGIASEQVILPAGIAAPDVRLAKAPAGWTLTATADGFTVAGAALPVGDDAVFSITITQLPANATELVFKTLETYSDGEVSRWIEVPEAGKPEPDNPAPVLKLTPAAAPVTSSTAPTSATVTQPSTTPTVAHAGDSGIGFWITIAVIAVAVVTGLTLFLRSRRNSGRGDSS